MPRTLHYSQRDAYVRGLDDILSRPVLTLEQEFRRDKEWEDWKSKRHNLRDEWKYVNGAAYESDGTLAGARAPATPPRRHQRCASGPCVATRS